MGCGSSRVNDFKNCKINKVLIIVGPSGVGKGTLITKIKAEFPETFASKISHTTRYKRDGEENGKNYYFVSQEEFKKMLNNNELLEHNNFNNNFYGTSKKEIDKINKLGKICLLELDINGANQVHKIHFPANYIAILPPSTDNIRERLKGRGTESDDVIEKRINIGLKEAEEIQKSHIFDFKIINGELEASYKEFKEIIMSLYPDNFKLEKKSRE